MSFEKSLSKPILVTVAVLVLVTICLAKLKVDYDKSVDFSKYKTYAWVTGWPAANPLADAAIQGAIDAELQKRGLQQVEAKDADLIVRYEAYVQTGFNDQVSNGALIAALGGNPVSGAAAFSVYTSGVSTSMTSQVVRNGSLVISLFDHAQKRLVWNAWDNGAVSSNRLKQLNKVNAAIAEMFDGYPAKASAH